MLADVLRKALDTPEGAQLLIGVAKQFLASRAEYKRLHWGREPEEGAPRLIEVDGGAPPLVALGALACVGYVTRKGGDSGPTVYLHTFDTPYPGLYTSGGRELVIVRGRSRFRVTADGIDG